MYYAISGEYKDGTNFSGEWLGAEADSFVVNDANESEVLQWLASSVLSMSFIKIRLPNSTVKAVMTHDIRSIAVTKNA